MPTVFVAYPYSIPKAEYRDSFSRAALVLDVEFRYADERITNQHVLDKIIEMMSEAAFNLFDITHWNANVALELGIAMGKDLGYYLLWNPTAEHDQPPSDLGGIDRMQYTDFDELESQVHRLLAQEFASPSGRIDESSQTSLAIVGVEEFWRTANASREGQADLQVVFLRVRNDRGPGAGAVVHDAIVHTAAYQDDRRILRCRGNWIDVSTGHPHSVPTKVMTLGPGDEAGIELAGKFRWQDDAYLAGQSDPPSLTPGGYVIQVTVADGQSEPETLEQEIRNPGADLPLTWS